MRGLIQDSENDQYHDWATVFYYGHMGREQIPGTPYYHYAFHEAGEQTAPEPSLIWDENIYGYTGDNHNFVFLWVCRNGDNTGASETIIFSVETPFPTTWVAAAIAIAITGGSALAIYYFKKLKRNSNNSQRDQSKP